ncbi:MAG: CoA transferase subunit A [Saccharofermentanales bacterium]|jgi:acetate CoA/acetoacetate CoA-transferase alpha subunit|nr:3-oxoacid CoA-transferase subunit A [Clostridiaceae bacterium]
MKNKVFSAQEAVARVKDGDHVMVGGFLQGGTPDVIVRELIRQGKKNLTVTSNDTGREGCAVYDLVFAGNVDRIIADYIGLNPRTGQMMIENPDSVQLFPQGTLAEKIRAGGFGLGGILTPTGVGTIVEQGKEKITIDGKEYLLELALRADVAMIRAHTADEAGNLIIRGTARNFNVVMAFAADYVIAEVDEIVPVGELDPDQITIPGTLIDAIVKGG